MRTNSLRTLLLIVLISMPTLIWTQITQPEGIYIDFITFQFEDPDYPVKMEMECNYDIYQDCVSHYPVNLFQHISERRFQEIPWAIVSGSSFYLNMRRFYMGDFYLKIDSLQKYTYFSGERTIGKGGGNEGAEKLLGHAISLVYGKMPIRNGNQVSNRDTISNGHVPVRFNHHYFLSLDDGMAYVLNQKNLLEICEDEVIRSELQSLDLRDNDIPLLCHYLKRINFPEKEIERPTIQSDDDEKDTQEDK